MTHQALENLNIDGFDPMPSPGEVHAALPVPDAVAETVARGRRDLQRILAREDHRLMVVVGPCSIHDPVAGLDYAQRLKALSDEVSDTLLLVMRVYFEKPRTAVGWKGFINDPRMDDSFHIEEGVRKAREFLLRIGEIGLPENLVVDCSHANSLKNPRLQSLVLQDCAHQILRGNGSIVGAMVESFLVEGNQPIPADLSTLKYGCSVTDACIGWEETVTMIRETRNLLKDALPKR